MLVRQICRVLTRFSKQKQVSSNIPTKLSKQTKAQQQYLVFPTKVPIFPFSIYAIRINKYFHDYLIKNNIKYVAACALQPGVAKKRFMPFSQDHLKTQLKLKDSGIQDKIQNQDQDQIVDFNRNNIIFDQPLQGQQVRPVYYVNDIKQVFPIASLCKLFFTQLPNKKQYVAHLRSQIRLQIDQKSCKYESDKQNYLVYVSGKNLKNQNLLNTGSQLKSLMQIYQKIYSISQINVPFHKQLSPIRTIQLLGGYLCTLSYFTPLQLYQVFSILNVVQRTKLMINYYKEYAHLLEVKWKDLNNKYKLGEDDSVDKQKQYVRGVYQNLQGMLGHKTDLEYIKKIKAKLATGRYPQSIAKVIEYQLQNIQDLGQGSPQINKKKQYINLLVGYPFGISAKQTFDIQKAKQILDQDHYGMKKIKQRILEFIAVSKLKGQFRSKVLLLHGPPGVGKTSIVKSIAKCLNRPYGRISLGGQYDTSIMKGHRKTYVGAYPGKIFDTIFKSKAENPVILLDQIDKIQARVGGASLQDVIMEVLDPIQNHKFKDQYLDIQIDLSKVLFVCTANQLNTIFPPLLDRLERIQVSGYTTGEKKQIFKRYVLKKSMENAGIPDQLMTKMDFTQQALHALIQGYCKEAGIRNLVRKTNAIFNKTALKFVKNQQFDTKISPKTLTNYIGLPKFNNVRLFEKIPPKGVIVGLAYNAFGGSIMYIQAMAAYIRKANQQTTTIQSKQQPRGSLIVTGNLHDVMKQSCQLAYSYAKYVTSTFFNSNFLEVNDVHLNFPQIQIGKDGPSAGVAITCSLVSLALNKPSIREIAMTGQITLSGKVSAIGGVKQKTMGAKREGITHLIFPQQNKRDVEQLQPEIKQGVNFYFANHFFEVMQLVFGQKITQKIENVQAIKASV